MSKTDKTKPIEPPPVVSTAQEAVGLDRFILPHEHCDAWFERRSDVLYVTFDNLASVGEYDPPQPWLQIRTARNGFSILGIISRRKDWYRNDSGPALLTSLRDAGLFDGFRRIVFVGTSMGGFAAVALSRIVPGSTVRAFSAQSTLSRDIAPFEKRYRYAFRKWDWTSPDFLDAADSVDAAGEVFLFYDPFIAEDRAHAKRMQGPAVREIKCGHFGHKLIRQLKGCGVLDDLFRDIGMGTFDEAAFRQRLRSRRTVRNWQKEFLGNVVSKGHPALAVRVAESLLRNDPNTRFARRTLNGLQADTSAKAEKAPQPGPETAPAPSISADSTGGPFAGTVLDLQGAVVVPERDHDTQLASGVLMADGSYCELSRAWIRAAKSTPVPTLSPDETVGQLDGAHMFAGHMRGHFGHFLVESTARLWALETLSGKIDSILYLPYRGSVTQARRAIKGMKDFFRLLDISVPVQTFGSAIKVERLYVPELGFGWQERYAGSPAYRKFMRERLGANVAPEGGELLYISRANLNPKRGGVFGETILEENLARMGYEIFHPERHPIEVQIARYKAARRIVALDGSALHLAAFFMREGGKVAIILRRSKANSADYALQYRSFCNIDPDVIDVIRNDWVSGDVARSDYRSVGELDFAELFARLKWFGYIPSDVEPALPSQRDVTDMVSGFSERRGQDFKSIPTG